MSDVLRIGDPLPLSPKNQRTLHLGDRVISWGQYVCHTVVTERIPGIRVRQYRVPCENGWNVSIIWGSATFSDNFDAWGSHYGDFTETPRTVELAVYGPDARLIPIPPVGDTVTRYRTVADAIALIDAVATWSSGEPGPWPQWEGV